MAEPLRENPISLEQLSFANPDYKNGGFTGSTIVEE